MLKILCAILILTGLLLAARPAHALEETLISYAGPSITFLPAEVARHL